MIFKRRNIGYSRGDILRSLKQPSPTATQFKMEPVVQHISDQEGLRKAYEQPNHIYIDKNRMYIAGSKSVQDWIDNALFIPTNTTVFHNIYRSASEELQKNPQITEVIGHSAGGSAVLELEKQYGDRIKKSRTYAAPVVSLFGNEPIDEKHLRMRTFLDPVAILDNSALTVNKNTINPFANHSFDNFGNIG